MPPAPGLAPPVEPRWGQPVRLSTRDAVGARDDPGGDPAWIRHKVIDGSCSGRGAERGRRSSGHDGARDDLGRATSSWARAARGGGSTRRSTRRSARRCWSRAARLMPDSRRSLRFDAAWAGLRPWLPDDHPAIGPSRVGPRPVARDRPRGRRRGARPGDRPCGWMQALVRRAAARGSRALRPRSASLVRDPEEAT